MTRVFHESGAGPAGDQRDHILVLPPLPDEVCLVDIETFSVRFFVMPFFPLLVLPESLFYGVVFPLGTAGETVP